jgi:tetratricopeptide (TPR) repeat protein
MVAVFADLPDEIQTTFGSFQSAGEEATQSGRFADALGAYSSAIALLDRFHLEHTPEYGSVLAGLALVFARTGRLDQAEAVNEKALFLANRNCHDEAGKYNLGGIKSNIARVFELRGDLKSAERCLRESIEINEGLLAAGLIDEDFKIVVIMALLSVCKNLGECLYGQGKIEEGIPWLLRALELGRRHLPPNHTLVIQTLNNLGNFCNQVGRFAEGERWFREVLVHERELEWTTDPEVFAGFFVGLSQALTSQHKHTEEAMALMKRALAIYTSRAPGAAQEHAATLQRNIRHCGVRLEAKKEKEKKEQAHQGISEETRAKMIAELIDEEEGANEKRSKKYRGRK